MAAPRHSKRASSHSSLSWDGGVILACNWAFGIVVGGIQKQDKLDGDAARARAKELMIPGVILQPNGIFAVPRAQEAGCRYVVAS